MLSIIELQHLMDAEKKNIDFFIQKNFDLIKLQFATRMRKQNVKKAKIFMATFILKKIPHFGGLISTAVEKVTHNKTLGETLDEAMTMYNIANIHLKKINSEITNETLRELAKAQLYIEFADELMRYIEQENSPFIQAVKLQFETKTPVVRTHLKRKLKSPEYIEMNVFH
ncbi:hypothetical protein SG34_029705 [Thalassomonas viridans]|uniref:Uncharacterized protein n=1 Tax=Thalassomonas viridans TaxID=137584 RepID=A0AAE9ZAH6_9GAMM|nr:hypothetical protein [Thalassomonas viridans]WDE08915.1 hypothetical protein SG34_034070 [Thalassomonas viridans]WDE08962.1 hypothetical protein SG34_029705 [Thalassomonas viridans]